HLARLRGVIRADNVQRSALRFDPRGGRIALRRRGALDSAERRGQHDAPDDTFRPSVHAACVTGHRSFLSSLHWWIAAYAVATPNNHPPEAASAKPFRIAIAGCHRTRMSSHWVTCSKLEETVPSATSGTTRPIPKVPISKAPNHGLPVRTIQTIKM